MFPCVRATVSLRLLCGIVLLLCAGVFSGRMMPHVSSASVLLFFYITSGVTDGNAFRRMLQFQFHLFPFFLSFPVVPDLPCCCAFGTAMR